jgi:hypothetical protein
MKKKFELAFGDTRKTGDLKYTFLISQDYKVEIYNDFYYIASDGQIEETPSFLGIGDFISVIELGDMLAEKGCLNYIGNKKQEIDFPIVSSWPEELQRHLELESKYYYYEMASNIIVWCKKYGFPFYEDGNLGILEDDSFYLDTGLHGFKIDSFIYRLIRLHMTFYRWKYSEFNEKSKLFNEKKFALNILGTPLSSTFSGDISYELTYKEKGEYFEFNWRSQNIFNLLSLQLALLATRRDPDGKQIKRCAKCNCWFEADQGAQKYCGKKRGCNAKAATQARWRAKNK